MRHRYGLERILKGEAGWPSAPEERDVLYFLAQSFRARLVKELPEERAQLSAAQRELVHVAMARIKELAQISLEIAQMVVGEARRRDGAAALAADRRGAGAAAAGGEDERVRSGLTPPSSLSARRGGAGPG